MNTESESPKSQGKSKIRRIIWIGIIGLSLLLLILGGIALYAAGQLRPVKPGDDEVRVLIPQGMGSGEIAAVLEQQGVIRDGFIFKIYLRYTGQGGHFQAGEYTIKPGLTLDQIIAKLNAGDTVKEEMIQFTIPEGFTIEQIADRLSEQQFIDRHTFMELLADQPPSWSSPWADEIPARDKLKHPLEGYLFPETYEMKKGSTEAELLNRMLHELDRKIQELPEDWKVQLEAKKISFHQMMTIASLIEREVVVPEERPIVAGVIFNRLRVHMKLQIDATVQYALGKQKERLFEKDLQVDSPYNTYLHEGLPPGPIASPSLDAIKAVLYPKETNYLFYVTKKDGSQEHWFAETFKQHQENIEKSNKTAN